VENNFSQSQQEFVNVCSRNRYFDSDFVYEDDGQDEQFEDDGFYHVRRNGVRVAFDVGEGQPRRCREVAQFVAREWDNR
jgi:hypothetical protein